MALGEGGVSPPAGTGGTTPGGGAKDAKKTDTTRAPRTPLDLDDIDVFLKAMETGDFGAEAMHYASKTDKTKEKPVPQDTTPAGILDKILPAAGDPNMLYSYEPDGPPHDDERKEKQVHVAAPWELNSESALKAQPLSEEQLRDIRALSRRNLQLNNQLVGKLTSILSLCDELQRDIAERHRRELKLAEANEMFQGLVNSLLQHKRDGHAGRRAADRRLRQSASIDVREIEERLLQQRDEMRSLQRQGMLMDRQCAEEDAKIAVLARELARVDPESCDVGETAPQPACIAEEALARGGGIPLAAFASPFTPEAPAPDSIDPDIAASIAASRATAARVPAAPPGGGGGGGTSGSVSGQRKHRPGRPDPQSAANTSSSRNAGRHVRVRESPTSVVAPSTGPPSASASPPAGRSPPIPAGVPTELFANADGSEGVLPPLPEPPYASTTPTH